MEKKQTTKKTTKTKENNLDDLIKQHEALTILIKADQELLAAYIDNFGRVNRELSPDKYKEKSDELNNLIMMDKEILDQMRKIILKK